MAVIKEETEDLRIAEVFSLNQDEIKKEIDLIPLKVEILNEIKEEKHLDEEEHDLITAEKKSSSSQTENTTQKTAEKIGDFSCQECGKHFVKKGHFENHLRTHTGESSFTCQTCGKGFTQKRNLRNHMKLHIEEDIFVCLQCRIRFSNLEEFKKHMKGHSGERLYVCLECGKSFVYKSLATIHRHKRS